MAALTAALARRERGDDTLVEIARSLQRLTLDYQPFVTHGGCFFGRERISRGPTARNVTDAQGKATRENFRRLQSF
jgi:hypothetical protein